VAKVANFGPMHMPTFVRPKRTFTRTC
jgi:hypothetical protein